MASFTFTALPPLSLYIHFPWCVEKCPYCDFNSHALRDELPEATYIDALLMDLEQELPTVWGRTVQTVFMGGGTPSLFSGHAINRLLDGVRARLPLKPDAEITLEANPGTLEQGRFADYREAGVNRLSIGMQSVDNRHLKALGRIHDAGQAVSAATAARAAGFENINLDLMFGLPEQSVAEAITDLQKIIELAPDHLSWYQLTLEANTRFHAFPPNLPDPEQKWEILQQGQSLLGKPSYTQYEVSAFSQPGKQSLHNLNYWKFGDYLGIGAGAHSKITDAASSRIKRRSKKRSPIDYIKTAGSPDCVENAKFLLPEDAIFEYALNRLRLTSAFTLTEFEQRCGLGREQIQPLIDQAVQDQLLIQNGEQIRHREKGWLFLDDLLQRFLPVEAENAR